MSKEQLSIAFIGVSGVGKTTLSRMLPDNEWFHYSVDYRLWTHYLSDELNDYLKKLAMEHPTLKTLLLKDAITVEHRVQFNNLLATSIYMGMLGDPKQGGSNEKDFIERMTHYHDQEVAAMLDIPKFMKRANDLYGYPNFLVDASGSICEVIDVDDPNNKVLNVLSKNSKIVYIKATDEHITELIERGIANPKPIYYRPAFLDEQIPKIYKKFGTDDVSTLDPRKVGSYLYPEVIAARLKRYDKIAEHGITISMDEAMSVNNSRELLELISSK